ncbi:D-Ala-D-Ala carboxypeptidase family metallohydrolase [Hyphomicrobium sp. LHD-15]|uniref:D-Ala-D-Ala carboxypeptidase family metallohydrolase n=1 Tax=Hyphomicrobium sp. LHD-15 TaxID=3072142 RepID=UPI00280F9B9A|nr:D-Ala-D-Ala carboxypeptidase family metallohydrolase [Hyphomicrobium sp. LHD-15]MDQ8699295.1 D-Ala-D-Ala carboxypeptidase family metallohydrolase [Hyphomicrobium sp. LHD-15]
MSQRIFAAFLGLAAAVCLVVPAEARVENGASRAHYAKDGRAASKRAYKQQRTYKQRSYAQKAYAKKRQAAYRTTGKVGKTAQYRGYKKKYASKGVKGRAARLQGRAMTASHSGGGGASASRGCLQASARGLLDRIEAQFGPVKVISTCRPGARIAGSGKPSKHGFGLAVDFDAGARKGAIVSWLRANHMAGGTMTYRNMSHIHVDIGPRFVSLGAGGRG